MLLNELVTINEEALVANAVNFDLMDDHNKNWLLCQGFVFNYDSDPNNYKKSTVSVLDAIRRSFHSTSEENIHLMVQDFGKGKSHFALAIANFFNKAHDSKEVEGILKQVEYATGANHSILEGLKSHKQQGRNLVICLSGDKSIDLKKHFLQALRKALESEGITDSIGQNICKKPLEYLKNLNAEQRQIANQYLEQQENPEEDLDTIIELLEQDNYQAISRVKEISRKFTGTDLPIDFEADIDVEAILTELVQNLCIGQNRRFQGILILFDELYNYLQLWANDPPRAGGSTLQLITNICERFRGRIALVCFSQIKLSNFTPATHLAEYKKVATRLELLKTTYEPAASLELVLDGLLAQQDLTAAWQAFISKWSETLLRLNKDTYQNYTANYYSTRNWEPQKFFTHITLGCFPLHPLTSYLLCNLDFTQGRTAIQFIQADVKKFISNELCEKNNNLNFIYPVTLVDAFADNFAASDYSAYSAYKYAYDSIAASADVEELTVIKALFLFYAAAASVAKITKSDAEKHEKILSLLTGISEAKIKTVLDKLCKEREILYHIAANNTYRFYSGGSGIQDLRKRLEEEIANQHVSIESVKEYLQSNISVLGANNAATPTRFIDNNKLNTSDWQFRTEISTVSDFRKALTTPQPKKEEIATVAYIIGATAEELNLLKSEIAQILTPPSDDLMSVKRRMIVSIASHPVADIARLNLMLKRAKLKSTQQEGAALTQLIQQLEEQIRIKVKKLFSSCTYYCHVSHKISVKDSENLSIVTSELLQELYPRVAPQEKNDKLALKSSKGSEIIAHVSRKLLAGNLCSDDFPVKASYVNLIEPVFVKSWKILKQSSTHYFVQEPTQQNVKAAWDKISEITALTGDKLEQKIYIEKIWETLSRPPYGYNEYTFTVLFAAWLAYHKSEVFIEGAFGIGKNSEQISRRTEALKKWASTNIFESPKKFINVWIKNTRPALIRRQPVTCPEVLPMVNYDLAEQYIQDIDNYLSNEPDLTKVNEINSTRRKLVKCVEQLNKKLAPIAQAENVLSLDNNDILVNIEQILSNCQKLQEQLPIENDGGYSVVPTPEQQRRRQEVSQAIIEKIGQTIDSECARVESLNSQADCETYKASINKLQNQISQFNYLPPRFVEQLQKALQNSNIRLSEIIEQQKVNSCINEVQRLYSTLKALATQAEYREIQTQIEQRVTTAPIAREKVTYKNIIKDIEAKQEALTQKISDWENQFTQNISSPSALQMSTSINKEIQRFTDEDSKARLNKLLERLNDIILQRETESEESDVINDVLDTAARKLAETENSKKFSDIFKAYKELEQLKLPLKIQATALKNKPAELDGIKSQSYTAVLAKINQTFENCDHPINKIFDYQQLQDSLQQIKGFISNCDDFIRLSDDLREAEDTLESQYNKFEKQEQDKQIIAAIRQKTLTNSNTIHLCEKTIAEIETLRSDFNYAEKFATDVEKIIKDFKDKVANYKQKLVNLREKLSTVKTSQEVSGVKNTHAQLKLIFSDSSEYNTYQELQTAIYSVEEDIERINRWEGLYKQSNSITSCDSTLETIIQEQANLHDIERFKYQLEQLQANLVNKKQGYINQLNELETKLSSIKNQKEAQTLQNDLNRKSSYYQASEQEPRYQALCAELGTFNNLLQVADTQKFDTIDNCKLEKERLQQWRQNTGQITATVRAMFDTIVADLDKTQQKLETQRREAAKKWFDEVVAKKQRLEQFAEAIKLNNATSLLKHIKQQKHEYEQILQLEEKQTLDEISTYCVETQNKDKESQILTLFQQLPHDTREALLERLADIHVNTTEEF
ncbi:hypothetical protein RIVM261_050350 [Rivularia sp. IAM M-261]|nr:hypothetical protein RIVM261_050350 [Rivularia sp. IAM M-261]